jgi:hypothetical protein
MEVSVWRVLAPEMVGFFCAVCAPCGNVPYTRFPSQISRIHQEFVMDTSEVDSGRSDSETVSAEFVRRSGTGRRKKNVPVQAPIHSSEFIGSIVDYSSLDIARTS